MKDNSSLFFLVQTLYRNEILRLLGGWVKIYQIPHVIFETTSQFFFKLCITFQFHER